MVMLKEGKDVFDVMAFQYERILKIRMMQLVLLDVQIADGWTSSPIPIRIFFQNSFVSFWC